MNILEFLNQIKFGPEYGDWSGAIVALGFGLVSLVLTVVSGILVYYRWQKENELRRQDQDRLARIEEEQNYLHLRKRYDEIWDKLTYKGLRHLHIHYNETKDLKELFDEQELGRIKTYSWQLINLLSDIEFLYFQKQNSVYWKRWEAVFKFVFEKPFIKTAFVRNKEDFMTNSSFVSYVETLMESKGEPEGEKDYKVTFKKVV